MANNSKITIKELAKMLEKTTRAIEMQIKILKNNKIIKRVGSDIDGYWKVTDNIEEKKPNV